MASWRIGEGKGAGDREIERWWLQSSNKCKVEKGEGTVAGVWKCEIEGGRTAALEGGERNMNNYIKDIGGQCFIKYLSSIQKAWEIKFTKKTADSELYYTVDVTEGHAR